MFRSVQYPVSSWILNRFLSLTQIQSVAATKLKEKIPSNDEIVLQNKIVNSSTTSTNVSDLNKTYSEKIHRIVDEISKLSLVEVMDLNELLKVKN